MISEERLIVSWKNLATLMNCGKCNCHSYMHFLADTYGVCDLIIKQNLYIYSSLNQLGDNTV